MAILTKSLGYTCYLYGSDKRNKFEARGGYFYLDLTDDSNMARIKVVFKSGNVKNRCLFEPDNFNRLQKEMAYAFVDLM